MNDNGRERFIRAFARQVRKVAEQDPARVKGSMAGAACRRSGNLYDDEQRCPQRGGPNQPHDPEVEES